MVGKKIGPYSIVAELGAGGMAVVYKAEQPSLERAVAIKELRTELAKDPAIVTRFEREAKSIAALAHQNIVHVYDFITRGTSMYIVMEYVEGIDLYDLLHRTERLPADIAAIIALQAARALEYAHYHGVVHRDFKPSNLMLTKQGDVKLMDFGIARDENLDDLTLPGQALGTPSYMSPEQIMGERVDGRSDIFSFGIVLYQMLTGEKPFVDDNTLSAMHKILNEPFKRPRALYPDIPWALQRIVKRCLRKDPRDRYATSEDLRRALERYTARTVRTNYAGRLVVYMRHRDLITDDEAHTYVLPEALHSPSMVESDAGKLSGWAVVLRPMLLLYAALLVCLGGFAYGVGALGLGEIPGYLRIHAEPWANVYIDGELHDTTPFAQRVAVRPGEHTIEFRNEHFGNATRDVEIESGETKRVVVRLGRGR